MRSGRSSGRTHEHAIASTTPDCSRKTPSHEGSAARRTRQPDVLLISNNAKDFEPLHQEVDHAGVLVYSDQRLPDDDPKGLARVVETVLEQYGSEEVRDEIVGADRWDELL
jgi:hypothetical protein